MSVHYTSPVWKCQGLTGIAKLIALKFADSANDDGECYPSIATVCRECGVSRATAQRHVAWLTRSGVLEMLTEANTEFRSRKYRFNLAALKRLGKATGEGPQSEAGGETDPPHSEAGPASPEGGDPPHSEAQTINDRSRNPSAHGRARGASSPDGSPRGGPASEAAGQDGAPADGGGKSEPVNAIWRAAMPALYRQDVKQFHWVAELIPESDDGDTLTLLVPNEFALQQIRGRVRFALLSRLTERNIELRLNDRLPRDAFKAQKDRIQELVNTEVGGAKVGNGRKR